MKRLIVSLVVLAAFGCGNYSNDDVEFLNALPHASDLTVKVPQTATSQSGLGGNDAGPAASCGDELGQTSCYFEFTVGTSGNFNLGLHGILDILDTVESLPPTGRTQSSRTWGPFPDSSHPGFDAKVVIARTPPDYYDWSFNYRQSFSAADVPWFAFVSGHFEAVGGPRKGPGTMFADGPGAVALGLNTGTLNGASIDAGFQTDANPIVVDVFAQGTSGGLPVTLSYHAREYVDDSWFPDGGALEFQIPTTLADGGPVQLDLQTSWALTGEGIGFAQILSPPSRVGTSYTQCWGNAPAYLIDFAQITSDGGVYSEGDAGSCPSAL